MRGLKLGLNDADMRLSSDGGGVEGQVGRSGCVEVLVVTDTEGEGNYCR
jgi:hypothetical protein